MPEQIYRAVWCHVYALTCARLHAADGEAASDFAEIEADWAAAIAVEKWDDAKQTMAVAHANKAKEAAEG